MATATVQNGASNFISHGDPNATWQNEIRAYETMRATIPVGDPYVKKTHKDIKLKETIYNPITQKYNDPNFEDCARQQEQANFTDVIAKNKVRTSLHQILG